MPSAEVGLTVRALPQPTITQIGPDPNCASDIDCDDGLPCTIDRCLNGNCISKVSCPAPDGCHGTGTCSAAGCSYPVKADNTTCSDGLACTTGDVCIKGVCVAGPKVACTTADPCLKPGTCTEPGGTCSAPTAQPDGTGCAAGANRCLQSWACRSGVCTGATPVTCLAVDACHDPGACDPSSGACAVGPAKTDGTSCPGNNPCLQSYSCQSGVCVGTNAVVCPVADACHDAATCDPTTGKCGAAPAKADGTGCNDGNACTHTDKCVSGVCKGGDAVVCTALDQCHRAGTCDASSGTCSNPVKTGSRCDDGDACSYGDACADSGACVGQKVVCTSDATATRTCNGTATCDVTPKPGAACDDGDPCTAGDVRRTDGTCGGMVYTCPVTACLVSSKCDGKGGCTTVAKPDGSDCDADKSACTPHDSCQGGVCVADPRPVTCVAKDCNNGACDPQTGNCVYTPTSGGECGLTGCFTRGMCTNGICSGQPKDCSSLNQACGTGICDALSGNCVLAPIANGTPCPAGGLCTAAAVCAFGACELADTACPAASSPCMLPACDPATGQCKESHRPEGAACEPGTGCTVDAVCTADGQCIGSPAPNGQDCTTTDGQVGQCAVGSCVPTGGANDGGATPVTDAAGPDATATDATSGKSGGGGCAIGGDLGGRGPGSLLALLALVRVARRRRR